MRTWTRIAGAALTFALSTACTVTVGDGVDDSDDLDFTDKTEDPETTEEETSSTREPTSSSSETVTSETSATSSEPVNTSSEPTSDPTSTSSDTTTEEPVGICDGVPEPYTCEECVAINCYADWMACCAKEGCVETWTQLHTCVVNDAMEGDPWDDFDRCAAEASPTGDQIDLPDEVLNLTSCVNAPYMAGENEDDPLDHQDGEGTCTMACYNVFAFE